jgi:hypothetical protein
MPAMECGDAALEAAERLEMGLLRE